MSKNPFPTKKLEKSKTNFDCFSSLPTRVKSSSQKNSWGLSWGLFLDTGHGPSRYLLFHFYFMSPKQAFFVMLSKNRLFLFPQHPYLFWGVKKSFHLQVLWPNKKKRSSPCWPWMPKTRLLLIKKRFFSLDLFFNSIRPFHSWTIFCGFLQVEKGPNGTTSPFSFRHLVHLAKLCRCLSF